VGVLIQPGRRAIARRGADPITRSAARGVQRYVQYRSWALVVAGLALACSGSSSSPDPATLGPCPVEVTDLALYQTLKIPLVTGGALVTGRKVDVVAGKQALVRGFLGPVDASAGPVTVKGRLTVTSPAGTATFEDSKTISASSTDDALGSTLDFQVDAGNVRGDSTVALDILEPATCRNKPEQARLPRQGNAPLAARATGRLNVVLVPVRYDADGSMRMPDTSVAQLERLRQTMTALYPVGAVDITVHDPVSLSLALVGGSGSAWAQFLDSVRSLRASDSAADDAYYYGVVQPALTLGGYCNGACIAGISFQVTEDRPTLRVGVGLDYPGDTSALTLAHEIGHGHGRGHAPCLANAGLDVNYPYDGGVTSTWGYDLRLGTLIPPTRKDLMGYCQPQWISDYNYQALLERSAQVNPPLAQVLGARDFQVLLVGADGTVSKGAPLTGFLPPAEMTRESATLLGGAGEDLGSVDVYRLPLADVDVQMVLVPNMPAAARTMRLPSAARPLRLDLASEPLRLGR
jgi:hypothetical protein